MTRFYQLVRKWFLKLGVSLERNQDFDLEALLEEIWPVAISDDLIRVGTQDGDGGYLIPKSLQNPSCVFSPGVSDNADFEQFFLKKGIPCYLIDASVEAPPFEHELISFEKKWLSAITTEDSLTLDDWVRQSNPPQGDLLLQMDIEGGEYEAVLATSRETLDRFSVIVIELHHLLMVTSRSGRKLFDLLLGKLRASHTIVHAHPNNCCSKISIGRSSWPEILELTLVRTDLLKHEKSSTVGLPHRLDQNNTAKRGILLRH